MITASLSPPAGTVLPFQKGKLQARWWVRECLSWVWTQSWWTAGPCYHATSQFTVSWEKIRAKHARWRKVFGGRSLRGDGADPIPLIILPESASLLFSKFGAQAQPLHSLAGGRPSRCCVIIGLEIGLQGKPSLISSGKRKAIQWRPLPSLSPSRVVNSPKNTACEIALEVCCREVEGDGILMWSTL